MSSETSLLYGWTHIPSTNWSSGGRRPTYWGYGGYRPRREAEGRLITQTVPWGPLFDHFPGFNNFDKIGVPGSIPHVCFFLGFSGAAQSFFRGKNRHFPKLIKGTLDFDVFLMNFDDFGSFLIIFLLIQPVARRGNGSNFGPFLKIQSGTLDFWIFL